MPKLFEKTVINHMTLANRFVRSATWLGMADKDGGATDELANAMGALATGGVGLIISGHAYVEKRGAVGPGQLGVYDDALIAGLEKITRTVHDSGGKIVLQLAHGGFFAKTEFTGEIPLAVSIVEEVDDTPRKEMTRDDVRALPAAFTAGAKRAKAAGFDGLQLHSAHGYLLSQFLSPIFNRRTDEYGGDIRGRSRIHLEILAAVRAAVGPDYPVMIKINCGDYYKKGLNLEDAVAAGKRLAEAGIDAIEVSGGTFISGRLNPCRVGINKPAKEAYFREAAQAFKDAVTVPIMLVGGIRSYETAEELITTETADYISLSRPLIREPGLIKRWKSGDLQKSACVSDNQCFKPPLTGKHVYCLTEEKERMKSK